jgi:GntR family transcriptional regulator
MRFWLSKSSEVPLREQLQAQIILGIVSNDLKPGQRLPSTRELARRYRIHQNTVSAAYRELGQRGWVEFRKGSGVYVPHLVNESLDGALELDRLLALLFKAARMQGLRLSEIQDRLRPFLALQPPDHFLVVDPDPELRLIILNEITECTGATATGCGVTECGDANLLAGAIPVALPAQAESVRAVLPAHADLLVLPTRSVPESLKGQTPPAADSIIAIVSRWPDFLRWSRAILVGAGLDPAALSFRDARREGWQRGIKQAEFVITDSFTSKRLPAGCQARVFRVLSDKAINEVRQVADQFIVAC